MAASKIPQSLLLSREAPEGHNRDTNKDSKYAYYSNKIHSVPFAPSPESHTKHAVPADVLNEYLLTTADMLGHYEIMQAGGIKTKYEEAEYEAVLSWTSRDGKIFRSLVAYIDNNGFGLHLSTLVKGGVRGAMRGDYFADWFDYLDRRPVA